MSDESVSDSLKDVRDGGQQVVDDGGSTAANKREYLESKNAEIEAEIAALRGRRRDGMISCLAIVVIGSAVLWARGQSSAQIITTGGACVIATVILWSNFTNTIRRREELAAARKALIEAESGIGDASSLLGMMSINRSEMRVYDIQARGQSAVAHWMSLGAMTIGLCILGVGLWIAVNSDEASTKYAAAIIAAVGTATGGYIAQTFIRMNSDAQQHVRYYFEQPLVQSYLLTAERFITQMPEGDRPKQYALLVEAAIKQAAMVRGRGDEAAPGPQSSGGGSAA